MYLGSGPTTLAALFSDSVLNVPPFQRAFAWRQEPQLRNFVEDLTNHSESTDKRYFFGTILLTASINFGSDILTGYAIVDGQQRLTSTCIFVACALPRLQADPAFTGIAKKYFDRFIQDGLETRKFHTIADDDNFFQHFIIQNQTADLSQCDTPSQQRLLKAKQYFTERMANMPTATIARLVKVLFESQILVYAVDSDAEATQIFELQNDRGLRLTDLEAMKSFLMHGLYL